MSATQKNPAKMASIQLFKDQFSTNTRIKNEKVTSQILLQQKSLKEILNIKYSLNLPNFELPLYTQIEQMKGFPDQNQDIASKFKLMNQPSASTNLNMHESKVHLGNNEQNKDLLGVGNAQTGATSEQNKEGPPHISYEDIKNQFGKVGGDLDAMSERASGANRTQEDRITTASRLAPSTKGMQEKVGSQ